MKFSKRNKKNKRREEAIEYLNVPAWDEDRKIDFKRKKKFDLPAGATDKQKLDNIEEKVDKLQPVTKKGKKKKIFQILFLVLCSVLSVSLLLFTSEEELIPLGEVLAGENIGYLALALLLLGIMLLADTIKFVYLTNVTTSRFRPFLSFKVCILGRYYDCITPLGTGGQPFQMYYLSKRDVPVGVATSIPMLKYFLGQVAILLMVLGLMLFVPIDIAGFNLDITAFNATKAAAYLGLGVNSFVPLFITFITLMPKVGKKITGGILRMGSRFKIVKNYDTTYTKVIRNVEDFQTSMRYVSSNPLHVMSIMLLTVVEYVCYLSIPYYISLAFGAQASWSFYFTILSMGAITQFAVSLVPTPGTSGAAEAVFLIMFRNLFPKGAFWAMLIWRFLTYYMFIILGMIVNFYDFIKQTAKERFIERRKLFNMREKLIPRLNVQSGEERLAGLRVLKQIEKDDKFFVPSPREHDMKISLKTDYSYMPFTPSYVAYKLHESGARVAGIMDYDTVSGAKEFNEACEVLGVTALLGTEVKTYISRTKKRNIRINNLYQKDIITLRMTAIAPNSLERVNEWLEKYRRKRNDRNIKMTELINKKYRPYGIILNYERDVVQLARGEEGGSITEWHLLYALAIELINRFGRGQILLRFITQELEIDITEKMRQHLLDVTDNDIYIYDLINVLKGEVKNFYIDADAECCSILEFLKLAKDIGAIVVYPYMGDIIQNFLGEYRVEKFEDSFLEELLKELKDLGVQAVSFEPSRLTDEQLSKIMRLCDEMGLMQLSGETIYSVRQSFAASILDEEKFAHLRNCVWAAAGNVKALENGLNSSMFSSQTIQSYPKLEERVLIYSALGKYGKRPDVNPPAALNGVDRKGSEKLK